MDLNVQNILGRLRGSEYVHSIKSFGEENPETVFYVIWLKGGGSGFFSNVFQVLGHLVVAESLGMTPIVDMERVKTLYNEVEPIEGTRNAWEYYFSQLCDVSLDAVYKSKYVVFCHGRLIESITDGIDIPGRMARKYLHVRSHIQEFCDEYVSRFFTGKKVLGIHFRGQEQRLAPLHPTPAQPDQVIERTRMLLERFSID